MISISTYLIATSVTLEKFKLNKFGEVQNYIDSKILSSCEPYIPRKTGALIKSGYVGRGFVGWSAPYARTQYYNNKGNSLRGPRWFTRMWADKSKEILNGARGIVSDNRTSSNIFKNVSFAEKGTFVRRLFGL